MIFWILSAVLTATCIGLLWRDLAQTKTNKHFSYAVAILIPLCTLGLYAQLGTPNMPDIPSPYKNNSVEQILLAERPLLKKLRQTPNNVQLWLDLSQVYLEAGRIENAIDSLQEGFKKTNDKRLKIKLESLKN